MYNWRAELVPQVWRDGNAGTSRQNFRLHPTTRNSRNSKKDNDSSVSRNHVRDIDIVT